MPLNIPMPTSGGEALQRGVESGASLFSTLLGQKIQKAQMAQQWQEHLRNSAIREAQEQRLMKELLLHQESHNFKKEAQPLNLDLLRAKIETQKASAEKSRMPENPDKAARTAQLKTPWSNMTTTQKENLAALANGLGIRPDVFVEGMTSGKNFEQIAQENGYNKEDIETLIPKYLPTASNVTQENERKKGLAELQVFENKVTEWMAPYARKVAGMSPKQVMDSLKGENTNELAKYFAALSLQPEIAALRIKVMGGNMSHAALEDIVKANFGKSHINESLVGPEVYKKMNHYLSQLLKEGSSAATGEIYGRPSPKTKMVNGKEYDVHSSEENEEIVKTWNRKTKRAE